MFSGCQTITLDAQYRMAVPVRFRKLVSESSQGTSSQGANSQGTVVATKGIEGKKLFVTLYTLKKWEEIQAKIKTLPSANPVSQQIRRLLIGSACELELDGNNRILLPATLRNYMHLDKKAVMMGVGDVIELWDETEWAACEQAYQQESVDFTQLPEIFQNLNFY